MPQDFRYPNAPLKQAAFPFESKFKISKPFKFEMHKPKLNLKSLQPQETELIIGELCGLESLSAVLEPSPSSQEAPKRSRATVAATARMLGCTRRAVERVVQAFKAGGSLAVSKLRWGGGRPLQFHGLSQREMDYAVSKRTLKKQAHMTIAERAANLSQKTGKSISPYQLRKLYRGRGVTMQVPRARLGAPKLESPEVQVNELLNCKNKFVLARRQGYEIIACDSSLFNPKHVRSASWAPIGSPHQHSQRYSPVRYISVHGAASVERGLIHCCYKKPMQKTTKREAQAGFNGADILKFFQELKAMTPHPFAIFQDNASYSSTPEIQAWAVENEVPLIYNVRYRPDCNGIEGIWGWAKREYRNQVKYFRAMDMKWDQLEVVSTIMKRVPMSTAIAYIKSGWTCLEAARPILPEDTSNWQRRGFDPEVFFKRKIASESASCADQAVSENCESEDSSVVDEKESCSES